MSHPTARRALRLTALTAGLTAAFAVVAVWDFMRALLEDENTPPYFDLAP